MAAVMAKDVECIMASHSYRQCVFFLVSRKAQTTTFIGFLIRNTMMKRCRAEGSRTFCLNVGGSTFEVAADTLERIPFFEPIVSGRFAWDVDGKGHMFIDRSPDMFAIILQCVRTSTRPSREVLDRCRHELQDEVDFYCIDWLGEAIRNQPSDRQLNADATSLRIFERMGRHYFETGLGERPSEKMLRDLHAEDMSPIAPAVLALPLLFQCRARENKVLKPLGEFRSYFDDWSGGLLPALENIGPGICIAGGSVLGALCGHSAGDIDIFITDPPRAEELCQQVFRAVQQNQSARHGTTSKLLVTRSVNAVTVYRMGGSGGPPKRKFPPVQIITSVFHGVLDLLLGFDVDCCAVAYELHAQRAVATERAVRAIRHRTNIADPLFHTAGYMRRLEKYAKRGFAVAVPDLDTRFVHGSVLRGSYVFVEDMDLLLRVGEINPRHVAVSRCGAKATSVQTGIAQKGLLRMYVMDRMRVKTLHRGLAAGTHVLSAGCRDMYHVFRGVRRRSVRGGSDDSDETKGSSDDEAYVGIPTETIDALFTCALRADLREDGAQIHEDSWLRGGAMQRLAHYMHLGKMHHVQSIAMEGFFGDTAQEQKVHFVYDFATCGDSWRALRYVHDAGRRPLRALGTEEFQERYGIPRCLKFDRRAPRRKANANWFEDLY